MRFFFRITPSTAGPSVPLQQTMTSKTTAAIEDSSRTLSSEISATVTQPSSKPEHNDLQDKSLPPKPVPAPELPRDSSTENTTNKCSEGQSAIVSAPQPLDVVVSNPIPVPATVASLSSTVTTCSVALTSPSLQTTTQTTSSRTLTKSSAQSTTVTSTETTVVAKTAPSGDVSNGPMPISDSNVMKTMSTDKHPVVPTQEDSTSNNLHKSAPVGTKENRSAEQSVSKAGTKVFARPSPLTTNQTPPQPVSKETNQKDKSQIPVQATPVSNVSQKTDQIPNGFLKTEKEPQSPLPEASSSGVSDRRKEDKGAIQSETNSEEISSSNIKHKMQTEECNGMSQSSTSTTFGSSASTKAALSKHLQQRLHSSRKPTHPIKILPETSNTKGHPLVTKNPSLTAKDNKTRTNIKLTEQPTVLSANSVVKKENPQVKSASNEKVEVTKKESNSVPTNSQKEMPSTGSSLAPAINNVNKSAGINNNKVPPHNQQLIKNNQQILKKNDEIMRCVPVKRPAQPMPRKMSDIKSSAQHREDDKTNAKKRRIPITNPMKRPLNASDTSQPDAKKLRDILENNRKPAQPEQKTSQQKMRLPNPVAGQAPGIKSESGVNTAPNTLRNNYHVSMHLGPSEVKRREVSNQGTAKTNAISERVQTNTVPQRPPSTSQVNTGPPAAIKLEPRSSKSDVPQSPVRVSPQNATPAVAHTSRQCPTPLPPGLKGKPGAEADGMAALDLSASPRRQQHPSILSIAQTLARRQQLQCPSPAPPPLSPLSSLSPFPVMPGVPVRSPPPQLRIPVPQHRSGHAQQQRPSSLSSSSPSPPADTIPNSSRMGPPPQQQQSTPDMYAPHLISPATLMFRQQLELQRLLGAAKHAIPPGMEWYNDPNYIKRIENVMKSLQQQQNAGRNSPFYPYNNNNNNTAAATSNYRK